MKKKCGCNELLERVPNMRIDVGCGNRCKESYIGIDKFSFPGVDHVLNLEYMDLPFADNTVDEIFCNHMLEHVQNIIFIMNNFHRVLKPGGILGIGIPLVGAYQGDNFKLGFGAFLDPTHCRYFVEDSFLYWTKDYVGNTDVGIKGSFKIINKEINLAAIGKTANKSVNMHIILKKE